MRLGILGGTFNPVHNGHLHIAEHVLAAMNLNRIYLIPAYLPPHKKLHGNATAHDRLCMLRAALRPYKKKLTLSTCELHRKGKSYTVDTVRYFKKKYGRECELFLIVGTDSESSLHRWKNIKAVMRLAGVVVVPRPNSKPRGRLPTLFIKDKRPLDVSSTQIRKLVQQGKAIRHLVPASVARYIKNKGLYVR